MPCETGKSAHGVRKIGQTPNQWMKRTRGVLSLKDRVIEYSSCSALRDWYNDRLHLVIAVNFSQFAIGRIVRPVRHHRLFRPTNAVDQVSDFRFAPQPCGRIY
jgi:hypothetical protein